MNKKEAKLTKDQRMKLQRELKEKSIRLNELNRLRFDPSEVVENRLKDGLRNRIIETNKILEGKIPPPNEQRATVGAI